LGRAKSKPPEKGMAEGEWRFFEIAADQGKKKRPQKYSPEKQ